MKDIVKDFIENNNYLNDTKYHKGIRYSQTILGGYKQRCIICKSDNAEVQIYHNRKTGNKYIHSGKICFSCGKEIEKYIKG